jgi:hypothetical protein
MPIFWRPASIHYRRAVPLSRREKLQLNVQTCIANLLSDLPARCEVMEGLNDYAEI